MRYTVDDIIAMRANAERAKWWTAAIVIFAIILLVFSLDFGPKPEGDPVPWTLEDIAVIVVPIAIGLFCIVMGFLKKKFTLLDGDDFDGGSFGD